MARVHRLRAVVEQRDPSLDAPLEEARPLRSFVRLYLAANAIALAVAFALGGPMAGEATEAAGIVLGWCSIGG